MLYFIDALTLMFLAAVWSKAGSINILIVLTYTTLAMVNLVGSVPFVTKWITF